MDTFNFSCVPNIVSAPGAAQSLASLIRQHFPQVRRVLVVTDPGFLATGLVDAPVAALENAGFAVSIYSDVRADPPEAVVIQAAEFARGCAAELVIGLGGGSSMDVAKLIAVLAGSRQELKTMYGIGNVTGDRLPLIQVPTTAGTGSEMTHISIITTGETTKMGVVAPQLFADIAVLDADLTLGLPPKATAATGIDAMVHAIEAYTNKNTKNPISDVLAYKSLSLLYTHIDAVCENGKDRSARQAMLLGSMLAGMAVASSPCAGVHALAYPVGGIFHVVHGISNALVLPEVLRFNVPAAAHQYAELAAIVAPAARGSDEAKAMSMIEELERLAARLHVETRLSQVGIKESDLDRMAEDAMLQTRLLKNNPREITQADARAIYAATL
ncbi:iron-containing alcohol dehydrogenase [Noviherbaspirillum denitrificans]|uniref:iron-containing alcohol dehydrogenase n=1 Tax=Noviherbaspirillum denitrificans TaxID=1968433 RepID=UPI003B3B1700